MLWTLLGTKFGSLSILWNWGKIPCCWASFHHLLPLSMPTSFRGHYLLYWDHHWVLLHPKMNIQWLFQTASPTTTAHSNVFNQSASSKWDLSCMVFCSNRMPRPKSMSQWVTTNWWQKKPCQYPAAWVQKFLFGFSNKLLRQKPLGTTITCFPVGYYLLSCL